MKTFFYIAGGVMLLGSVGRLIFVLVAVANHEAGYTTLTGLTPALIVHAAVAFLGMLLIGVGQRVKQPATK